MSLLSYVSEHAPSQVLAPPSAAAMLGPTPSGKLKASV